MENINWNYFIGIMGLLATILASGIGVWYFLLIPKLSYFINILPFINPSNVDKSIKNKLKIIYNNQEVEQLSLARVIICNEGKGVADNFSSPITIKFNKKILYVVPNEKVLVSGIIDEYTISRDNTKVEFKPNFINQGENIYFDFVLESTKDIDIEVTGRCKGCSAIKKVQGPKRNRITSIILLILSLFLTLTMVVFCAFSHKRIVAIQEELANNQKEIAASYHKLYNTFENDEKNIHEIANNIKTYGDIVEAYITCKSKLEFYINDAKRNLSEKIKAIEEDKKDETLYPVKLHEREE